MSGQTYDVVLVSTAGSSTDEPDDDIQPDRREPADFDALFALALREHRAGRFAEAAAAYRQILAIQPDSAEAHNNLGNVLWSRASSTKRRHVTSKRIALKPDYVDAHSNLGTVLLSQGKLDEAAAHYEQALALRPDNAERHNNLGVIRWQQGRLDEAAARFEQASRSPAQLSRRTQQPGQRAAEPGQARRSPAAITSKRSLLRPDSAEAHNNLGNVLSRQGKLDQALARYRASACPPAGLCRSAQQPGQCAEAQGKLDQAAARVRAGARAPAQTTPTRTTTWASSSGSEASSTKRPHVTSKRSLSGPILPTRKWDWPLATWSKEITSAAGLPTKRGCALPGLCAAAQPAALDGRTLGRTQPVVAGRARPGRYAPFRPLCPAAEGARRSRRAGLFTRRSAGCWPLIPIWTSCLFWVPPRSCRAAIFIFRCSVPRACLARMPRRFPVKFPTSGPIPS